MINSMTYPPFPTCLLHLRAKTHSLWPIEGSLFLNQWLSFWAYQWFTLNCTVFSVCITKKTNQLFLVTIISCAIENFKIIKGSRLNKHEKTVWKSPKPVKISHHVQKCSRWINKWTMINNDEVKIENIKWSIFGD